MSTLSITSRGQVTLRKEILQHLGIETGEKIDINLLPNGKAELSAIKNKASFDDLHGFLKNKTNGAVLSIEEINKAISEYPSKDMHENHS